MEDELRTILYKTLSINNNERSEAESQLNQITETNLVNYFPLLANFLQNEEENESLRKVAALSFKNTISAKNQVDDHLKAQRWLNIPPEITHTIKDQLLRVLYTHNESVSNSACQVISKLARIELPEKRWPNFLEILLDLVKGEHIHAKRASITCLQYLCEEMVEILEEFNKELLYEEQTNKILTAVVKGMEDPEPVIRAASCRAFYHCVPFARKNFENEVERNYILNVIIQTCRNSAFPNVQRRSFECLVQIVSDFYSFMKPYMNEIFQLTLEVISQDDYDVAIPALEIWNTICDEEIAILNGESRHTNLNFIETALSYLMPHLLDTLTKHTHDECEYYDDWSISKSAAICISLCAQVVEDKILEYVIPFAQTHSSSEDWHYREAAMLAYGCIMEGPKRHTLGPLVKDSFPNLCVSLLDVSEEVKDTAAWTLGRMVAFDATHIIPSLGDLNQPHTPFNIIVNSLKDSPRVATNVCWIINQIADQLEQNVYTQDDQKHIISTVLDPSFSQLCFKLIEVIERPDANDGNLMESAFNTLTTLIINVGDSCKPVMHNLFTYFIKRLESSLNMENTPNLEDYKGLICGCIQVLITRLGQESVKYTDITWNCLLHIFSKPPISFKIYEDAFLATSSLAIVLDSEFEKYMASLHPILIAALYNTEEPRTCKICIELVGDISRALRNRFSLYCESILQILYKILAETHIDRSLKSVTMISLGDIAMAITGDFAKFYSPFMELLHSAATTNIESGPVDDLEWIWYLNELREGVLQAYSGIIYGLGDGGQTHILKPNLPNMLELVRIVAVEEEPYFSASNLSSAIALTGDLIRTFNTEFIQNSSQWELIQFMIVKASSLTEEDAGPSYKDCQEKAKWLKQLVYQQ